MKRLVLLIAALLLTVPSVAANTVTSPLWLDAAIIVILFGIPVGIFEGFLVWLFVRGGSAWRWLWLPMLVLANSVSWIVGVLFSVLVQRQYGFRAYMEGIYDLGAFFLFAAVVFVLTTIIEWAVLYLFRKKHGVGATAMLRAIVYANLISYAVLVLWFVIYALRQRASFPL